MIPALGLFFQCNAQGNLLVTPKRVVFEGNKQKEELSLVNIGKDTVTFFISFVQKSMKEDGSFVTIEKPDLGQMFADSYLRIFPRMVTLAPGEPQLVMLQCRRSQDMQAGEYRSHLYFRAEKNNIPLGMESSHKDTTQLSVQLIPVYGLSIPVIIRSGEVSGSATLSDLKPEISDGIIQNLKLTINRTGNISLYGDISAEFITAQGKSFEIGTVKGVGVYTTINKRNISLKINNVSGSPLKNGRLKVHFTSSEGSRYAIYAESEIVIK